MNSDILAHRHAGFDSIRIGSSIQAKVLDESRLSQTGRDESASVAEAERANAHDEQYEDVTELELGTLVLVVDHAVDGVLVYLIHDGGCSVRAKVERWIRRVRMMSTRGLYELCYCSDEVPTCMYRVISVRIKGEDHSRRKSKYRWGMGVEFC